MLVARLQAVRPGIRVLYVSGYTPDAVARYGIGTASELGVRVLAKPFTPDGLARRVREVLDEGAP